MANTMKPKKELKKPAHRAKSGEEIARDAEREAEDAFAAEDGPIFDAEKFLEHVDNIRALKHKGAEIRGKIGAAVKNAEEDYGIHRGASALWIKLKGMEDEARTAFLKAFDDMRAALGYAEQGELFKGVNSPAEAATFAGRDV